jgi:serine/threonine protein phosphatase PrpC
MHLFDAPACSLRTEFKADFPRRITRHWREEVVADALQRGIPVITSGEPGSPVSVRYGSTLIASLVVADSILIGQIGDGDVVLVRPDGTLECPVPADTTLPGNETRSLSSRDAHLLWRTATLDRGDGGVLIAATDGISDSFDGTEGEEFLTFIRSLVDRIGRYGIEKVMGSMKDWLDRYSTLGSGDDMTVVILCINGTGIQGAAVPRKRPAPGTADWGV